MSSLCDEFVLEGDVLSMDPATPVAQKGWSVVVSLMVLCSSTIILAWAFFLAAIVTSVDRD